MIRNFKSLEIWKRSRALVREVYLMTNQLPKEERFGLQSQIRRAAVTVPSNIDEGCGRSHIAELKQYLSVASGSLCELETQLYLLMDLNMIEEHRIQSLTSEVEEIRRMIAGYSKSIVKK